MAVRNWSNSESYVGKMEAPGRLRDLRTESVWALTSHKSPESWFSLELLGTQHRVGVKEMSVWDT